MFGATDSISRCSPARRLSRPLSRRAACRHLLGTGLLVAAGACGCSPKPTSTGRIRVTVTTGMVADLVRRIGGEQVEIRTLMGPGVDPHLYKATASDVVALQQAEVIFYSGLHLEGKMQEVFEQVQRSGRRIRAVTEVLPHARLLQPPGAENQHDPHVWFDVDLWAGCVEAITPELAGLRPDLRTQFEANAARARDELKALHDWAKARAGEVPEAHRVLVTSHDAFNYFGRAYGFRVVALQGISTVTEASLADLTRLVDFIKAQAVRAIFVESSVSHVTLERISRDAGVKIGGELFSDAMGTPGQMEDGYDLGTYDGMIRHNLNLLHRALK